MISVLMSTYNGCKTIDSAIRSILKQTYKNFKFIICDDASTDDTWKHLIYWSKKDNRIILFKHKFNEGLQISLDDCLKYSKNSKYIARMDDDDISNPFRFQKQVNFLNSHNNISFVSSYVYFFDDSRGVYGENKCDKYPTKYQLLKTNEFYNAPVMIRSNVIKSVNGYSKNKKYYRVEDYELWLRLYSLDYRGANIPEPLYKIRRNLHDNSYKFYDYFNRFRLISKYRQIFNVGIKGYYCVFLTFIRLFIPPFIRNIIYLFKYSKEKRR